MRVASRCRNYKSSRMRSCYRLALVTTLASLGAADLLIFAPAYGQGAKNDRATKNSSDKNDGAGSGSPKADQSDVGLAPGSSKELDTLLGLPPGTSAAGGLGATPEWVETGIPPEGYGNFEVVDTTIGMRDVNFNRMTITYDGTVWAGTWGGRIYSTTDDGATWNESTVLPEVKAIFGFPDQRSLLGKIRDDGVTYPTAHELVKTQLFRKANIFNFSFNLFEGSRVTNYGVPQTWNLNPHFTYAQDVDDFGTGLETESRTGSGSGGFVLGAGLSSRAPRLSILLNVKKRPIANISLTRLLVTTAKRGTKTRHVARHPDYPNIMFLTTSFGLYRSRDGGVNWMRVFGGMTIKERSMHEVKFEPGNPKRMYLASKRGFFVSDDMGNTWARNTGVPEIEIRHIAIDKQEPRYIYVIGKGGVYRSDNRGVNWIFSYYHSLETRRNVMWMTIDAFDSNTAYIGTEDGLLVTHNLRKSISTDWKEMAGLRTTGIPVFQVESCWRHPGHLYMLTRSNLPKINMDNINGPENFVLETWDYGKTWRHLAANRTQGDMVWINMEPEDPDTLWAMFSRALVRIDRIAKPPEKLTAEQERLMLTKRVADDYPSIGEVLKATRDYSRTAPDVYTNDVDRLRLRRWLPSQFMITARSGRYRVGGIEDDVRFLEDRIKFRQNLNETRVVAWAMWRLPEILYRHDSALMIQTRIPRMNHEVRVNVRNTVHRNYGELLRLVARVRSDTKRGLMQRAIEETRREYLEAIVDFSSGGFLTRWKEEHR